LPDVVTCSNMDCENYGYEMKRELEVCSVCGAKTKKLAFDFNPRLTFPAIAIAIISTVVYTFIYLYMNNYAAMLEGPLVDIITYSRIGLFAASIVMGFLSKNKAAIIVTLLALPVSATLYNYVMWMQ